MNVLLLDSPMILSEGRYKYESPYSEEALKTFVSVQDGFYSCIRNSAKAEIMSKLVGRKVDVTERASNMMSGQQAIVLVLNKRPPEGKVLTAEEIENIGYSFKIISRVM